MEKMTKSFQVGSYSFLTDLLAFGNNALRAEVRCWASDETPTCEDERYV